MAAEAYALLSHIVDNNELPIDEAVRPRVRAGAAISSREYLEVLAERERLKAEFAAATAQVDALLAPVDDDAGHPARDGRSEHHAGLLHALGQFPRSVRVGRAQWLHPRPDCRCRLQIVCRGGEEAMALRIGWAWQNATDWHERVPPLAA